MRSFAFASVFIFMTAFIGGCGSSQDSERDWTLIPPMDTTAQPRKTTFETRTDTVNAEGGQPRSQPDQDSFGSAIVRFTVQIGSFSEAKRASAAQATARRRYQLPVVNDYNAQRKRYQIRIGFFETEEAANRFCTRLKTEFPREYYDAWVAPITK